jgi:hypothetical protein
LLVLEVRGVRLRLRCAIFHARLLYARLLRLGLRPILDVSRVGLRLRLRLVVVAPVLRIGLGLLAVFVMRIAGFVVRIASVGLRLRLPVLLTILDVPIRRIRLWLIVVVVASIPRIRLRLRMIFKPRVRARLRLHRAVL